MAPPLSDVGTGSQAQTVAAALALYAIYYLYWQITVGASRRRIIKENGCKPIRNSPELNSWADSIIGWKLFLENAKAYKEHRLLEHLRDRFERNGYTIHTRLLTTHSYLTVEPENLKTMLALKFKDFSLPDRRKSAFLPVLGAGIFTTDGAAWQHSRELLRPNFVRSQVGDLETFETHVNHLVQAIPRDGSTVDIEDLFFQLTMDSATEFLFGESTNVLVPGSSHEAGQRFADAWNESMEGISTRLRAGALWTWITGSKFRENVRYVHEFLDHYVQRALTYRRNLDLEKFNPKGEGRYIFLEELAKATNDPEQIRSELLNILLAGRDTTASLLSNVWFMLAQRPEIWKRLRAEVDQLGGDKPTLGQIKEMKYLRMVLNESLRLQPVVPSSSRMSVVDTVLPRGGGPDGKSPLFIPAKTNVQYSVFAMHRRKDLYGEDAEEFKPERWENLKPGWEYLPFSGGPRICIGQQFALTEASYTTIRLMQEFKSVESREPGPWKEWITITCAVNGAKVALTPAKVLGKLC